MTAFKKLLAWAQKNERHLGGILFIGGFITDILTFTLLDLSLVNVLFAGYLGLAALAVIGSHAAQAKGGERPKVLIRTFRVALPLAAQYLIGNLLSGFLIFYTKSSVLAVSWPFLVLLAAIFFGNEWFRKYRERLAFLSVLFFFTLYAYVIFALPLLIGTLGPWVFLGSSLIAAVAFWLFLLVLKRISAAKLEESRAPIIGSSLAILIVVTISYFTGLVPPIPLTLKEGGIYHAISRREGDYVLTAEAARAWFDFRPPALSVPEGGSLYAFTSVFAPIRFSTSVVHRWERKDERGRWVTEARIAFPIAGGRASGYRGYSEKDSLAPGTWRVSVETPGGQVIGRIRFTVTAAQSLPSLHEETH